MLIEFQQALADMVASPPLCRLIRKDPSILRDRYDLNEREYDRVLEMVRNRGMEGACMLYRANRLAPLALNLPEVCRTLGEKLPAVLDNYWTAYPKTDAHFIVESHRFCMFLQDEIKQGRSLPGDVVEALAAELPVLIARLDASYTELRFSRSHVVTAFDASPNVPGSNP